MTRDEQIKAVENIIYESSLWHRPHHGYEAVKLAADIVDYYGVKIEQSERNGFQRGVRAINKNSRKGSPFGGKK